VVRAYQLYLRNEKSWDWIGTIDADTHADAFRTALLCLGPGDDQRPIRLEQDIEGAYRKPSSRIVPSPSPG
jgi:hypothetical protein